jgi:hypothetical protein
VLACRHHDSLPHRLTVSFTPRLRTRQEYVPQNSQPLLVMLGARRPLGYTSFTTSPRGCFGGFRFSRPSSGCASYQVSAEIALSEEREKANSGPYFIFRWTSCILALIAHMADSFEVSKRVPIRPLHESVRDLMIQFNPDEDLQDQVECTGEKPHHMIAQVMLSYEFEGFNNQLDLPNIFTRIHPNRPNNGLYCGC